MAPSRTFGRRTRALDVVEGMDLERKTYFITGGHSGKGFETARALALRNAHVVIGCPNYVHGMDARGDILEEKRDVKVDIIQLDNSDLQSVKDCAEKYVAKGWPLHCLILNDCVFDPVHRITDDEFETTFQVNHLAHFLLTNLLAPLLIRSAPSRVVVVTSEGHRHASMTSLSSADITWARLSPTHTHSLNASLIAYNLSRLCNVLFANTLHQRLSSYDVAVNCVNPGLAKVDLDHCKSKLFRGLHLMAKPWMKTAEQCAATIVYCSVWPDLTAENGGKYYDNCQVKSPSSSAHKVELAERLWETSEFMIDTYEKKRERTFAKLERRVTSTSSTGSGLRSISEDQELDDAVVVEQVT